MLPVEQESRAYKMFAWINAQLDEGRTVYASNHLRTIKITPKHRQCVRLRGQHVETQHGRRWDSIIWCNLTAR